MGRELGKYSDQLGSLRHRRFTTGLFSLMNDGVQAPAGEAGFMSKDTHLPGRYPQLLVCRILLFSATTPPTSMRRFTECCLDMVELRQGGGGWRDFSGTLTAAFLYRVFLS